MNLHSAHTTHESVLLSVVQESINMPNGPPSMLSHPETRWKYSRGPPLNRFRVMAEYPRKYQRCPKVYHYPKSQEIPERIICCKRL